MENKRSKLLIVVIIALIAGLIASIVMIHDLSEQIENLQISLSDQMSSVSASIGSIYSNVDEELKKQTSLVTSVEEYKGNLDEENLTVPVSIKIVPKSVTDDTKLSVQIGDKAYPLSKASGAEYSADINVSLFNTDYAYLLVESGGETKSELLEDVYITDIWYGYLPSISYADFNGSENYSDGKFILKGDIGVDYDESAKMDLRGFEKFSLEAFVNGEKVWEQDVTDVIKKTEREIPFSRSFEMKQSDAFTVDVVAVDGAGIIHRATAYAKGYESYDGETVETSEAYAGDSLFYSDGTPVIK